MQVPGRASTARRALNHGYLLAEGEKKNTEMATQ